MLYFPGLSVQQERNRIPELQGRLAAEGAAHRTAPFALHRLHCIVCTAPFALCRSHCTVCTAPFALHRLAVPVVVVSLVGGSASVSGGGGSGSGSGSASASASASASGSASGSAGGCTGPFALNHLCCIDTGHDRGERKSQRGLKTPPHEAREAQPQEVCNQRHA